MLNMIFVRIIKKPIDVLVENKTGVYVFAWFQGQKNAHFLLF